MPARNPIEFVRYLYDQTLQRVGNRIKKEGFRHTTDYGDWAQANTDAVVTLPAPAAGFCWRFDCIHWSYFGAGPVGAVVIVDASGPIYVLDIDSWWPVRDTLRFDTTRWTADSAITITLTAGGVGVFGDLNVIGVRQERLAGDY